MQSIDALVRRVRAQGGKVTPQRVLIWRALEGDQTHPTAEEIYVRLRSQLPGLALATVYNTLSELVEWGEVRRFDAGDGHIHYDPDCSAHAEVVCLKCHTIIDLPDRTSQPPIPTELAGFRVVLRSEQYFGYCPACRLANETMQGESVQ
jgi:Fe2+ or Zn2+ uptake regulation protein